MLGSIVRFKNDPIRNRQFTTHTRSDNRKAVQYIRYKGNVALPRMRSLHEVSIRERIWMEMAGLSRAIAEMDVTYEIEYSMVDDGDPLYITDDDSMAQFTFTCDIIPCAEWDYDNDTNITTVSLHEVPVGTVVSVNYMSDILGLDQIDYLSQLNDSWRIISRDVTSLNGSAGIATTVVIMTTPMTQIHGDSYYPIEQAENAVTYINRDLKRFNALAARAVAVASIPTARDITNLMSLTDESVHEAISSSVLIVGGIDSDIENDDRYHSLVTDEFDDIRVTRDIDPSSLSRYIMITMSEGYAID